MFSREIFCYIIYFTLIVLQTCTANDTVEVTLKQGVLSGKVKTTLLKQQNYYAFKGVPYALPPMDNLRLKPPTPHEGWEGVYRAHKNQPTCLQFNTRMRMDESFGISGSEDCLYLSIFTPNLEGSKAVIVFEYNDNFQTGFNGTKTYSPDFFMDEDVIVVTISHRLGLFGYLSTEDEVIPGNIGLRDYILGLKWIKENIEHFGGDPNRITLMGVRGGAVMANVLLYIEQAKGLFSGIILQSGSAYESLFFHTNPKRVALKLAEQMNITATDSTTLLAELQKIDAKALLEQQSKATRDEPIEMYQIVILPFALTIEPEMPNALLTSFPENNNIVNDVPVLMGFNSREGIDLALHYMFQPKAITDTDNAFLFHFPIRPGFRFDPESSVYENALNEVREFYFEDGYLHYNNVLEYAVYLGDILQNYAENYAAKKLVKNLKSKVFFYLFDFYGLLNENTIFITRYSLTPPGNWGATIGDDLCYLHVCARIQNKYKQIVKLVSEQYEIKTAKRMARMWTNFAKFGNPTPSKEDDLLTSLSWQPVEKEDEINYLHIGKKLTMKSNPLGKREKFWDTFLAKYASMAVDGVVQAAESRNEL